eukprot:1156701-Pyramimonas_sp.AAC.1
MSSTDDPATKHGSMKNMAPMEGLHAFIGAIARDSRLNVNGELADDVMVKWAEFAGFAPFRIELISNQEDMWWRACQLLESVSEDCTTMEHTAFQRVCEVNAIKRAEEQVWQGPTNPISVLLLQLPLFVGMFIVIRISLSLPLPHPRHPWMWFSPVSEKTIIRRIQE